MTYDETWDDSRTRRSPIVPVVALLAVLALGASLLLLVRESRAVGVERTARRAQVAALTRRVAALEARDARLTGRLGSAERTLKRREAGIAPLAARVLRSVFTVEVDGRLGSGFVAWRDGDSTYLLTANHVVEGTVIGGVTVTRKGKSWAAEISAQDPKNDLALIRMNGKPAGAAPLWQRPSRRAPQVGDQLLLVGSPFGLAGTVTTGVVSRVTKSLVQTDAAANPGNSGGPAIDRQGQVVGVLVAGGGENINFAIRIDRVCVKLRRC
ncbi:MAG: S1C family serine protease [Gaiellaceae bacterium]